MQVCKQYIMSQWFLRRSFWMHITRKIISDNHIALCDWNVKLVVISVYMILANLWKVYLSEANVVYIMTAHN